MSCDRCEANDTIQRSLRERFAFLFLPFCQYFSVEAPYILHAFNLPSQTVFDFLSQRHKKLCFFISDTMDFFLAGNDQQQTNRPNNQAGVLPLLVIYPG